MKLTSLPPCPLANGRSLHVAWLLAAVLVSPAIAASTLHRDIAPPTSTNEFNPFAVLTWNAETDGVYQAQRRAALSASERAKSYFLLVQQATNHSDSRSKQGL